MMEKLNNSWSRQTIAALGIGSIVAIIGPFGTFVDLSMAQRFAYWIPIVALGWAQWVLLEKVLRKLAVGMFGDWPGPWWGCELLLCLLTPIPLIVEIVVFREAFGLPTGMSWTELYIWTAGITALNCIFVVGVVHWVQYRPDDSDAGAEASVPSAAADRFLERLAPDKRGRLLCLRTEDHYLRVYTDRGEDLILFRLKDALKELEDHDGRQVHRSYWVARDAVTEAKRSGRKVLLVLRNGVEVPVSETYTADLKKAGWIT